MVVLELDTPGGLETSMREIIKDILNSPIPVATWVGPSGARAASAGTYILYASHVAAMAPASNLGAATPVAIGGGGGPATPAPPTDSGRPSGKSEAERATSTDAPHEKAVNDSAAYLRSLAQLRGRNADFAEKAVREARSMSAQEALSAHVIDLIAPDIDELLKRIDGRKVALGSSTIELQTAGAPLVLIEPGWRTKLLTVVSNPMVAVVLMMLGVYGLFIEIIHPGAAVPGVAGSICLLLALYAFHLLPVNWAGVGLILLGAAMMIAELFLPTFGVIGVGGIIALIAGTLMLVDPELPGFGVPLAFVTAFAALSALAIFGAGGFALRARRRPVVSGREALLGADGVVTVSAMEETWARVQGESWRVRSPRALSPGQRVRVVAVDGLTLQVEPSEAGKPAADH
jgi:membrane-bound serine protease (ClpP class)